MSTITAILEAAPDGSIHLPIPQELRGQKLKVIASVEPVTRQVTPGLWTTLPGKFWIAEDFDAPLDDFKDYGVPVLW